jgi:hypothetical protein
MGVLNILELFTTREMLQQNIRGAILTALDAMAKNT